MDPPLQQISNEETESFATMLDSMDPKLLQGYKTFLHEVLIQGISRYNLTLNTLRCCLFNWNTEIIAQIVERAISYYDDRAPEHIKSFAL